MSTENEEFDVGNVPEIMLNAEQEARLAEILARPYHREVVREEEGWTARLVEWQGCMGSGDTEAEALADLKEAMKAWAASCLVDDVPMPEALQGHRVFAASPPGFTLPQSKDRRKIHKIAPCLLFDGNAEDAAKFYAQTFPDSRINAINRSPSDYPDGKEGDVLTVEFIILGMPFVGINGGPQFNFNESVSFQIYTDDQAETDRYWHAIVDNGGSENVCGWCKDRFGLSWQIVPRVLMDAVRSSDHAAGKRAMDAMMQMKKIDIAKIEAAIRG